MSESGQNTNKCPKTSTVSEERVCARRKALG